ncbi:Exonuclease 3'-5' domain-containing protein 2 [Acipenser ruthenus]|uniref:Exonuclease 3'-5' domain-containing protein 2 n=1 Tax=Acipenser ruthenus TaxID=7906 RepID=A0A444UJS3_ACIRT|nr:Exonuclease 3'-5' domain-containing protein 2 [Acipenser ruthenus]
MSRQSVISTAVLTLLGTTLGGLVIWKAVKSWRQKISNSNHNGELGKVRKREQQQELEGELEGVVVSEHSHWPSLPLAEQLLKVEPALVSCADDWEEVWPAVQRELGVYPVLGIDCEWVSVKGKAGPVALLQMSTFSGLCVAIRLLKFRGDGQTVPRSLLDILQDDSILKAGVGCYEDACRLMRDYGITVNCTVDLRYLAMRQRRTLVHNGLSLKSLAQDILNLSLDKSLQLRCSNWEAEELSQEQVLDRSHFNFRAALLPRLPVLCVSVSYTLIQVQQNVKSPLYDNCFLHAPDGQPLCTCDKKKAKWYLDKGIGELLSEDPFIVKLKFEPSGRPESQQDYYLTAKENICVVCGRTESYIRKSPLYDNCFLHAPDGQPLCTCDKKKAKWYLDKGIGELLSEDPFIVKLKFEPSGRPESQQDYYLTAKENICVVCGRTESYIRKNIVPHEYRRHFPIQMKDHNSHDVLLLCTSCHAASNYHDNLLKQQLSEEHSAPLGCEEGVRPLEDPDRRQVRSGARALLKADSLPESRREELLGTLRTFYSLDEVTPALLQEAAGLETRIFNESYIPHGLKVVQAYTKGGLRSLMELEKRWRQHFLTSMQPRHIPPLWSVEHNHSKLLRKYGEAC